MAVIACVVDYVCYFVVVSVLAVDYGCYCFCFVIIIVIAVDYGC